MKVVTARQMQEIDRRTIAGMGMPGMVLMALAGKAVADEILAAYPAVQAVAIVCGKGNNGGDGMVAAWFLHNAGRAVQIYLAAAADALADEPRAYCRFCRELGIPVSECAAMPEGLPAFDDVDLIVDALYGTGFHGTPPPAIGAVITAINDSDLPVVAIDLPSGLGADGAAPEGEAVIADLTITIGLPKLSLVTYPGKEYTGRLVVADIGFPVQIVNDAAIATELIDGEYCNSIHAAARESAYSGAPDADKHSRGHVLVIGGFDGMEGAGIMAAAAAFQTGAGYVTLLTTEEARRAIAGRRPELMTAAIPDAVLDGRTANGASIGQWVARFLAARRYDCIIAGPGMGRGAGARTLLAAVLDAIPAAGIRALIVDGDALYHLPDVAQAGLGACAMIVTPHRGEAARLLDVDRGFVDRDRPANATALARRYGAVAVLKGPATIVTDGTLVRVNTTGNPALATAGSGDVLAGIIGALVLRGHAPLDAAALAVYLHGAAADRLAASGHDLIKATDLLDALPETRHRLFTVGPVRQ